MTILSPHKMTIPINTVCRSQLAYFQTLTLKNRLSFYEHIPEPVDCLTHQDLIVSIQQLF